MTETTRDKRTDTTVENDIIALGSMTVIGMEWFDRQNGNSYCAVRVFGPTGNLLAVAPFQYGYGNYFEQAAEEAIIEAGIVGDHRWENGNTVYYPSDFGLTFIARRQTRRDVKAWGQV